MQTQSLFLSQALEPHRTPKLCNFADLFLVVFLFFIFAAAAAAASLYAPPIVVWASKSVRIYFASFCIENILQFILLCILRSVLCEEPPIVDQ